MPTILGANTLSSGYDVANSLRFNGDNFLQRNNPSSNSTDGTKGTFSFWVKRDKFPNESQVLVHQQDSSTKRFALQIANNDEFIFSIRNDAESVDIDGTTTLDSVYRDVAAWYHFLFNYDTSGGTNGCKLFVNGAEQALSYSATLPQNFVMTVNTNGFNNHTIGRDSTQSSNFWTGYMTEVMFVDGQQLAPTQFGEYDEDTPTVWKPKNISGINVGNLGYYLDFEDASNLGNDVKGVGDFSETNCATTDQATDTCTNNYATLNPLLPESNISFSEGNLKVSGDGSANWSSAVPTIGLTSGKWYWEWTATSNNNAFVGIVSESLIESNGLITDATPYDQNGLILYFTAGRKTVDGTDTESHFTAWSSGTMSCALDLDSGTRTIKMYHNGSQTGDTINLTGNFVSGDPVFPVFMVNSGSNTSIINANFGSPIYANSSDAADGNGYGAFP